MAINTSSPESRFYFVAKKGATLGLTGGVLFNPAGTSLLNTGNTANTVLGATYPAGYVQLQPGQIGFFDAHTHEQIDLASALTNDFYIAQGHNPSNDPQNLIERSYFRSEVIPASRPAKVMVRGCHVDSNDAWVVGAPAGSAGAINLLDNHVYKLNIAYRNNLVHRTMGRNMAGLNARRAVQGTWTDLGLATAPEQLNYVVKGLAAHINHHTRYAHSAVHDVNHPIVSLAIQTDTLNTANSVPLSDAQTAGNIITVGYVNNDVNRPIQVPVTNGMVTAVNNAIANNANITATSRIVAAVEGDNTNTADMLIIMALDRDNVPFDREPQMKYRIEVGLERGTFAPSVFSGQVSKVFEGFGYSRKLQLDYMRQSEVKRSNRRRQELEGMNWQYAQLFNEGAYMQVDFIFEKDYQSGAGTTGDQRFRHTLLVPCCNNATVVTEITTALNTCFLARDGWTLISEDATNSTTLGTVTTDCAATYNGDFNA